MMKYLDTIGVIALGILLGLMFGYAFLGGF